MANWVSSKFYYGTHKKKEYKELKAINLQ